ncbi:hypothetical protein [Herbaspirillum sp. NPDC087042]|uniref:hypothetical protein n=1 Tax=Herbaspirillum sp. NPDC087042 TaxID=3364004 RepID=UPI0038051912
MQNSEFRNRHRNKELFELHIPSFLTKEGLLPCSKMDIERSLSESKRFRFTENNELILYPVFHAMVVASYLAQHVTLWNFASLRVTGNWFLAGSAPYFGVNFKQAIEKIVKGDVKKGVFYLPEGCENSRYHSLIINMSHKDDAEMFQLEAWQCDPSSSQVRYLHSLSRDFRYGVTHLDGAIVELSSYEMERLFQTGTKEKGQNYKKYFRIDGDISMEHFLETSKRFLGNSELFDEVFCFGEI